VVHEPWRRVHETRNRSAAEQWISRLLERVEDASAAPFLGRIVPELAREDIRETYLRTYRIVYRADGQSDVIRHRLRDSSLAGSQSSAGRDPLGPSAAACE
jgi:plasmid stabilization system protein ParE